MDENTSVRTIVIGVSLLIAIATISAVLVYYNTARNLATRVTRNSGFASKYEDSIKDILISGSYSVAGTNYITGADVKNLLNYFYNDDTVIIDVNNVVYINNYENYKSKTTVNYENMQNANNDKDLYDWIMRNVLNSQKFVINKDENYDLFNKAKGMKLEITGIIE